MFLNFLTFPEFNLQNDFKEGINKIRNLPKTSKFLTIFWVLGPFVYLIERDPADLWLTTISIIFLVRCIKNSDWEWSGQLWFISAFMFWIISLVSSYLGAYTNFTLFQAFIWIRFPLYAAAAQVWLGRNREIRIVMFTSILFSMLLMCIILILEITFASKERLTWPYGDLMPGSYLAKISLPVFCTLIAVFSYQFHKEKLIIGFVALTSLIVTILTGERTNSLIRFCSGIISFFSWKFNIKRFFLTLIIIPIILFIIFIFLKQFNISHYKRFSSTFLNTIPILNMSDDNGYWGAWRSGIQQGLERPFIGYGANSSRKHCHKMANKKPEWLPGQTHCTNHPHNFYIQMFSDTGLIGLGFGIIMFLFFFLTCLRGRKLNPNCPMACTAFIVPLALFFPFQQTGNFFGQWSNLFLWFPLAFSISQIQDYKSIFRK